MVSVEYNKFCDLSSKYQTIFFTEQGILIDDYSKSPLLEFSKMNKSLSVTIKAIFLIDNVLIVKCELNIKSLKISKKYKIYPAKYFLTVADKKIHTVLLRAVHWLTWDSKFLYCSKCKSELYKKPNLAEKKCNVCNISFFPSLSPAIMVLIKRKDEILLARSPHFEKGVYSAIAGFIDIGENAESAVHREVKEEVGIEICKLEYFGTQSWPFPDSFMIAFKAEYLDGNITIDANEIEDAKWFNMQNLPKLPPSPSISRILIDSIFSTAKKLKKL